MAVTKSDPKAAGAGTRVSFRAIKVPGPYIAFTFDDGPHPQLTPKLLDLLAAHHLKATFFVVGKRVAQYPEIVARAAREGHEIGNHSWSHPRLLEIPDENVRQELQKTDAAIQAATGVRPRVMRPPGGALLQRQADWIHNEFRYTTVLWDVHGFDWVRPPPEPSAICNRIVERTHAGSIIVCHDVLPGTIEAMPSTFSQLEEKGFKFVTVSELLRLANR